MVVVLKKQKLVYIEEPRTASRSTHIWLTGAMRGISPWAAQHNGLPSHKCRHMGPVEFVDLVHQGELPLVQFMQDRLDEYRYFAFTRNPFSTVVTYYVKARNRRLAPEGREKEHNLAAKTGSFKEYIMQLLEKYPGVLDEQSHLQRLDACQHILKFEHGYPNTLFDFLAAQGVEVTAAHRQAFTHQGKTQYKKKDWRSYYEDAEIIEVVAGVYSNYLVRFGYDFDCS